MYEHLENLKQLHGDSIYVQVPNDIFRKLSKHIKNKNGSTNIQQSSFAYTYIVLMALLYKYAHFVDIDNNTYIQNADIKEMLGYSRTTKSIDSVIKKNGILDSIGLTTTTKQYPTSFYLDASEKFNEVSMRRFVTIDEMDESEISYKLIKDVVKNRNYEIKEVLFLFEREEENGTLYDYCNTHTVNLDEVLNFLKSDTLDNIDFYMYCFLKSKCKGYRANTNSIGLNTITLQLGISKDAFYSHLKLLEKRNYFDVAHKGWKTKTDEDEQLESNVYTFRGV